jgi:hypothetical protein
VLRALDPTLDAQRIHFNLRDFIWNTPDHPPGTAHGIDEFDLDNRSGMTTKTKVTLKYLRECRGLNHFIGICFPFTDQIEGAVADERVRYRLDVGRKGEPKGWFVIMEMQERTYHRPKGKPKVVRTWVKVSKPIPFEENSGPLWDAYKVKKRGSLKNLKQLAYALDEAELAPEEDEASGSGEGLIRTEGLADFLGGLESKYRDRAGPRSDVRASNP